LFVSASAVESASPVTSVPLITAIGLGAGGWTGVVCGGCVGGLLAAGWGDGEDSASTAATTTAAAATAPAKTIVARHGTATKRRRSGRRWAATSCC
jgi:hypothetical protein